jgi:hypothetical protein
MPLSMNAVEQCPSPARLKSHRAHGVVCPTCEPDAERRERCPKCGVRVTAVGLRLQAHAGRRDGWVVGCPGADVRLPAPTLTERRIVWVRPQPTRLQRALALLARDGAA